MSWDGREVDSRPKGSMWKFYPTGFGNGLSRDCVSRQPPKPRLWGGGFQVDISASGTPHLTWKQGMEALLVLV